MGGSNREQFSIRAPYCILSIVVISCQTEENRTALRKQIGKFPPKASFTRSIFLRDIHSGPVIRPPDNEIKEKTG